MRWEIERLLRAIIDSLRALEGAVREQSEAIRHNYGSDRNASNNQPIQPLPVEVVHAPDLDPARREYYEAENRERNSLWRWLKPWVETVGVSVAIVLAILTALTFWEIHKQTPKIAESADAAKRGVEISERIIKGTQAASIY